jgi:hypothetical protein
MRFRRRPSRAAVFAMLLAIASGMDGFPRLPGRKPHADSAAAAAAAPKGAAAPNGGQQQTAFIELK